MIRTGRHRRHDPTQGLDGHASGSDEALRSAIHAHAQVVWSAAYAVTDDQRLSAAVLDSVLLPLLSKEREGKDAARRAELIISAVQTAAAIRFTGARGHRGATAGASCGDATGPRQPIALAFRQRLPWHVQATLWAVAVEGVPEKQVARRLGGMAVPIAQCRELLNASLLGLAAERVAANNGFHEHPAAVTDIDAALGGLASGLPEEVWEKRWLRAQQTLGTAQQSLGMWPPPQPDEPRLAQAQSEARDADRGTTPSVLVDAAPAEPATNEIPIGQNGAPHRSLDTGVDAAEPKAAGQYESTEPVAANHGRWKFNIAETVIVDLLRQAPTHLGAGIPEASTDPTSDPSTVEGQKVAVDAAQPGP